MDNLEQARGHAPEWEILREAIHRQPELGNQEYHTAALVEQRLQSFGIRTERLLDTAVVGTLDGALPGKCAALRADLGYLARRSDTADIDLTVEQLGKSTVSEIHASGALMERAKKVFRGTIDFKRGSAGSVGSENETVLLLGEDAENKTVPVILCAEENVEGSHGATIGELDADTLFYFASRGIDRAAAEAILARAAVERLARMAEDEAFSARALGALAQVLCTKEERE